MRDEVLPGSMAYSAVSQPIDFPSRNGGTVSDKLAVTNTAVSPQRYSTLPGLLRTNPLSMVTGRIWSLVRLNDRVMAIRSLLLSRRRPTALCLLMIAQQPDQECHLKMKPVRSLGNDLAARA